MRRFLALTMLLLFMLVTRSVTADQQLTLRGEIADSYCFAARGIRGPAHTACALRCARRGSPLALVEEGTHKIYVLLPAKDESAMPESVVAAAGTVRTVSGRTFTNGGTRFLAVESIR